jgi:signal transduction histidine kinase
MAAKVEHRQATLRTDVAEEERRGLARELHDDMGQRIAALRLMLRDTDDIPLLEHFGQELSEMQRALRHLTRNLHPLELEHDGLARALETLGLRMPLPVEFTRSPDWTDPEAPVAIHLYRMCQEMLGNTLKHSHAGRVSIRLDRIGNDLRIEIEDDGIGFDAHAETSGLGRAGLQERADLLDALLELETAPDAGCRWRVLLPCS